MIPQQDGGAGPRAECGTQGDGGQMLGLRAVRRWSADRTPKALSWDPKDELEATQTSQPRSTQTPHIFHFQFAAFDQK